MGRYCFDIYDGDRFFVDDKGTESHNLKVIRDKAIAVLPDIAREKLPEGGFVRPKLRAPSSPVKLRHEKPLPLF